MKLRIVSLAAALALLAAVISTVEPASAQQTTSVQKNGARGLVAAVVNVSDVIDNNGTIDIAVIVLNNSLSTTSKTSSTTTRSPSSRTS